MTTRKVIIRKYGKGPTDSLFPERPLSRPSRIYSPLWPGEPLSWMRRPPSSFTSKIKLAAPLGTAS